MLRKCNAINDTIITKIYHMTGLKTASQRNL